MNSTDCTNIPDDPQQGSYTSLVRLEHLDQQLDHRARGIELPAFLPLGACELGEEVLVYAAEHVLGPARLVADLDVADEVDKLAQALLVERRPGVVFGEDTLKRRVVALDPCHSVVDQLADRRLLGLGLEVGPARPGRNPEDVVGPVLVAVLGISALGLLTDELRVLFFEGVGDVFQEDQAKGDVLILGGIHAAAERVGHLPELGFVFQRGAGVGFLLHLRGSCQSSLAGVQGSRAPKSERGLWHAHQARSAGAGGCR
jgi:hypothetical protein